jgi:L-lactate dehydrogenase complex protein LldE
MVDPDGLSQGSRPPRVGLLVACLAYPIRPKLGLAAIKLLEASGCEVEAPLGRTCCGRPAFNAGAMKAAAFFARETIRQFEQYDYVVTPSGPCAATIKAHYAEVLAGDPNWLPRALALAAKTWELTADPAFYDYIETKTGSKAGTGGADAQSQMHANALQAKEFTEMVGGAAQRAKSSS